MTPTPETLRKLAESMLWHADDVVAAAGAWDAERTTRHMEAAKFLSQIAAWKASCIAAEKRLEAEEKVYNAVVVEVKAHGGTLMPFDQAIAALAGEEKPGA